MLLFFGTMTSVWKLFYYSHKKALKGIQAVLGFPELNIVKPSDTSWLLHELCVRQFARNCLHCCKPFHSYASSGDAEAYGIYSLLVLMVYQAVISY